MLASIYHWLQGNWLLVLGIYMLILAISRPNDLNDFLDKTFKLITAPSSLDDYPAEEIDNIKEGFKVALTHIPESVNNWLIGRAQDLTTQAQWKLIGQFLLLISLIPFFVADLIVIAEFIALVRGSLPSWVPESTERLLGQYSLAIGVGTFFAILVMGIITAEMWGVIQPPLTDFANYQTPAKEIYKFSALLLLFLALLTGTSMGAKILGLSETMNLPTWIPALVDVLINVVLRFIVLACTFLIVSEAVRGLRTVLLILLGIAIAVSGFVRFVCTIIASGGRLTIDIVIKFFLWVIWVLTFLIINPIGSIPSAMGNLFGAIRDLLARKGR